MKKFFVMWSSQAFSIFGSSVVGFALAWYLAKKTDSATILSTAVIVMLIPGIVLGPFIGPFIDRWDRKKIMIYGDLSSALLTAILAILFFFDAAQLWHIYVIMAGRAIGNAFQGPAMMATFTSIVPEKDLTRAYGYNAMLSGLMNIIAPVAGAFLMEWLPMQGVLSVDIITAVIAIAVLLQLKIPRIERTTLSVKVNIFRDTVQSLRYVMERRGIKLVVILNTFFNIFTTPMFYLFPLLVTNRLAGDVLKLGWMNSACGIGTILGGALVGVWGGFKKKVHTILLGLFIVSVCSFSLGFTTIELFYFILVIMFILGLGAAVSDSPMPALLNVLIPKDMQGRLFAMFNSLGSLMVPLGLAIAGPFADAAGIEWVYFIGGSVFFVKLLIILFSKSVMHIEDVITEGKPAAETAPSLSPSVDP
jgi:DHA3 family macrolide efflux protein-like MFS transporter